MKLVCLALVALIIWIFGCCTSVTIASKEPDEHVGLLVRRPRKIREELKVTGILNKPFLIRKSNTNNIRTSGQDYEGYAVDLLEELKKIIDFSYKITVVRDGKYGTFDAKENKWYGMVGEIMDGEADLVVADLTVTPLRKSAINFTEPFMKTGIGMIMKRYSAMPSPFLAAFNQHVWIAIAVSVIIFSIVLFVLARLSGNEVTAVKTSSGVRHRNNLSLSDSFWFTIASIIFQNPGVSPRAVSTRLLAATWWLFCFLIFVCYVANVVHIIAERRNLGANGNPIRDVDDLVRQNVVKYGAIKGGSTRAFFETSSSPMYQRIYAFMELSSPSVYMKNSGEAIERVKQGNYAMFLEANNIEFLTERDCDLVQVGGVLDVKGYAIGFQNDFRYSDDFNEAINKLDAEGVLDKLKEKWWKKELGGGQCSSEEEGASSLSMGSISGLFILLMVGSSVSVIVALVELFWKATTTSGEPGGSACNEVVKQAKFALCGGEPSKAAANPDLEDGIVLQ